MVHISLDLQMMSSAQHHHIGFRILIKLFVIRNRMSFCMNIIKGRDYIMVNDEKCPVCANRKRLGGTHGGLGIHFSRDVWNQEFTSSSIV
jgi:hypothetical protein